MGRLLLRFFYFYFRLGLLEDEFIEKKYTPVDTLAKYLNKRLAFGEW
jgi:hypothetical protein